MVAPGYGYGGPWLWRATVMREASDVAPPRLHQPTRSQSPQLSAAFISSY